MAPWPRTPALASPDTGQVQWELALRRAARAGAPLPAGPAATVSRLNKPSVAPAGCVSPARGVRLELGLFISIHRLRGRAWARAVFLIATVAAAPALAQQQVVTVTATRTPVRADQAIAEVSVIDRADIARSEARTLVELLSRQPGLQFASNGGLGKAASLFIRGLEARHTLLLVDGVRVGSATVGSPSLDNLPLEAVDRIEIVRGPMSSLYGNGAMGGVIQVFTRRAPRGLAGNAKLSAGSNRYGQVSAGGSFGHAVFDVAAQLQHTDVDSPSATSPRFPFGHNPDRDGWRQTGGSLLVGLNPGGGWRLEALNLQAQGLTRIDDGPNADARAELHTRASSLTARGPVLGPWATRFTLADSLDAYDTIATAIRPPSLGVTRTKSRQFSWENTVVTPAGRALVLAERTNEKVARPGAAFAVNERDIDALALGLDGVAGAHRWQGSLRRDRNSQFGGVTTGALGYGFAFSEGWRVGASAGTSHALPSFNQLYFPGFGSPTLQPEKGRHAELSLRFAAGGHSLRAAAYAHRYRGFITSGPQPGNLPEVEIDGVTLAYEGQWRDWAFTGSLDRTDPRNSTVGNANFGKLLPRRARNAARAGADWEAGAFKAGATLAAFSHRFDNTANTTRLAGYATLDLRAEWAFAPGYALGLKLNNVADKRYETALGYEQPRREGFVVLRALWK
jgi:vitamin B12 transporter